MHLKIRITDETYRHYAKGATKGGYPNVEIYLENLLESIKKVDEMGIGTGRLLKFKKPSLTKS